MLSIIPALGVLLIFAFWRNIVWEIWAARDEAADQWRQKSDDRAYAWQQVAFTGFYITLFICFLEAWK